MFRLIGTEAPSKTLAKRLKFQTTVDEDQTREIDEEGYGNRGTCTVRATDSGSVTTLAMSKVRKAL